MTSTTYDHMMERRHPNERAAKLARRWRLLALGNTVSAMMTATVGLIYLSVPWSVLLTVFMALCVGDSWYLARRYQKRAR